MARRSIHTQDELRELIIAASTQLIESKGLSGLSAREIARSIEYSPGTIYNVFKNLDDVILAIELRLLERLANELEQVAGNGEQSSRLQLVAKRYVNFAHEHPKLWSLLFQNRLADGKDVPAQYQERLDGLVEVIEAALAKEGIALGADKLRQAARVIWTSLHGITLLSTADRLANVNEGTTPALVDDLIVTYLAGLDADS